ncbi:RICIN domain-containing protein [Streptomyces sp. NPDC004050]
MGVPDGVYRVRNVASGLLLREESGNRVGVGPQGPPAPPAALEWRISPVHSGGGIVHVVNVHSDRRLDVANASTESGARVQVWRPNAFGAQEWVVGGAPPTQGGGCRGGGLRGGVGGGGVGGPPPPPHPPRPHGRWRHRPAGRRGRHRRSRPPRPRPPPPRPPR